MFFFHFPYYVSWLLAFKMWAVILPHPVHSCLQNTTSIFISAQTSELDTHFASLLHSYYARLLWQNRREMAAAAAVSSDPDSPRLRKQVGDLPLVIAALPYTVLAQALRRRPRRSRSRSYVVSLGHTPSFTAAAAVTLTRDLWPFW